MVVLWRRTMRRSFFWLLRKGRKRVCWVSVGKGGGGGPGLTKTIIFDQTCCALYALPSGPVSPLFFSSFAAFLTIMVISWSYLRPWAENEKLTIQHVRTKEWCCLGAAIDLEPSRMEIGEGQNLFFFLERGGSCCCVLLPRDSYFRTHQSES